MEKKENKGKIGILNPLEEKEKISRSLVPNCLLEEGMNVLEISMSGCPPCKVLKKAIDELDGEMEGVNFHISGLGEEGTDEFTSELNLFMAPTIFFSDGETILWHIGGSMNVERQKEVLRFVVDRFDEFEYEPEVGHYVVSGDSIGMNKLVIE